MSYQQQRGFKNNWREIWTGKESEKGYRYERVEKVQKEDQDIWRKLCDASNSNPPEDGTSVTRGGFKFWFNANGPYGPSVARRQHDENYGQQKEYQGQNYTVKSPAENYVNPRQDRDEVLFKKIENIEGMLAELMMSLGKDPFQKAADVKSNTPDDHGNETSGSHYASGPGTLTDVQGTVTTNADIAREESNISPSDELEPEVEKLLEP